MRPKILLCLLLNFLIVFCNEKGKSQETDVQDFPPEYIEVSPTLSYKNMGRHPLDVFDRTVKTNKYTEKYLVPIAQNFQEILKKQNADLLYNLYSEKLKKVCREKYRKRYGIRNENAEIMDATIKKSIRSVIERKSLSDYEDDCLIESLMSLEWPARKKQNFHYYISFVTFLKIESKIFVRMQMKVESSAKDENGKDRSLMDSTQIEFFGERKGALYISYIDQSTLTYFETEKKLGYRMSTLESQRAIQEEVYRDYDKFIIYNKIPGILPEEE